MIGWATSIPMVYIMWDFWDEKLFFQPQCLIPKTHSAGVAKKNLGSPRIVWPIRSTTTVGGIEGSRATRDGVVALGPYTLVATNQSPKTGIYYPQCNPNATETSGFFWAQVIWNHRSKFLSNHGQPNSVRLTHQWHVIGILIKKRIEESPNNWVGFKKKHTQHNQIFGSLLNWWNGPAFLWHLILLNGTRYDPAENDLGKWVKWPMVSAVSCCLSLSKSRTAIEIVLWLLRSVWLNRQQ